MTFAFFVDDETFARNEQMYEDLVGQNLSTGTEIEKDAGKCESEV